MSVEPLFSSHPPALASPVTGLGSTFPPKNVSTIADAVANASGLNQNGTLTNALHPQTSTQPLVGPHPNSALAATINPAVNLQASASLQVTDFVNATPSAFPTVSSTPPPPTHASSDPNTQNQNSNPAPAQNSSQGFLQSSGGITPTPNPGVSTGIYNSVASASTSTIRGSGLDVSA